MTVDYERKRDRADSQIRKYGALAYLRRNGDASSDRECWALEVQLSTHERQSLRNLNQRVFLVSALGLAVPPDSKVDSLVLVDQASGTKRPPLRQIAPVAPLQPQPGGVVIYYEIQIEGGNV